MIYEIPTAENISITILGDEAVTFGRWIHTIYRNEAAHIGRITRRPFSCFVFRIPHAFSRHLYGNKIAFYSMRFWYGDLISHRMLKTELVT
jgi:hypothetical protein